MLSNIMSNRSHQHNNEPGFQATEALATNQKPKENYDGVFIEAPSTTLVDRHTQASPELFPQIEWSTNHEVKETANRRDYLRRLLSQRSLRRGSIGLVRSKSMLCLTSATEDYLLCHDLTVRRRSSSSLLSAAAKRQLKKVEAMEGKPLPPRRLSLLKRSGDLSPTSSIWNGQDCDQRQVECHDSETKPSLHKDATARSTEQRLLGCLLHDCPFPACP